MEYDENPYHDSEVQLTAYYRKLGHIEGMLEMLQDVPPEGMPIAIQRIMAYCEYQF